MSPVLQFDATFGLHQQVQTLYDFAPATDLNRFNGYNSVTDAYTFFKCKYHSVFERDWLCYSMPNKPRQRFNSSTLSICGTPIMEHLQSPYYTTS
jgi:hypothetical protein